MRSYFIHYYSLDIYKLTYFERACNKPTKKNSQTQADPPITNPLLHEGKNPPTSSRDTDITHQPCPIVLSTLTVKNNRAQLEKSDISVVTHTSYDNKLFKLTFIFDTGFPITLIREDLQRKLNITSQLIDPNFKISVLMVHILGATELNLTSDNRIWKIPVMITPYLKHKTILGLNFLKQSNTVINFADNVVNIGTDIKIPVIYTFPHAPASKYLLHSYGLVFIKRTILLFIVNHIISARLTALSFNLNCSQRIELPMNIISTNYT